MTRFPLAQDRLESMLALLPPSTAGLPPTALHFDGWLFGALCVQLAPEPVLAMDAQWGEHWSEELMAQELLEEFMSALEEHWHHLQEHLSLGSLREDPDALLIAELLPWTHQPTYSRASASTVQRPDAARAWATGFAAAARGLDLPPEAQELLEVVTALTLPPGPALQAYLERAYDAPDRTSASALIDDALFAAQDLRLLMAASTAA